MELEDMRKCMQAMRNRGPGKLRIWGVGGPEKIQGLKNGIPGEMEYLGKWRTCGVKGHEKMHAGLEKWRTWGNRGPGEMEDPGKWRTWGNGGPG